MNIAVVPHHDKLLKDKLFDIKDLKLNRDNILNVYDQIREVLKEKGHEFKTIDMYSSLEQVDYILFFSLDYKQLIKCLKNNMQDRLIYFAWEPEVVDENHSKAGIERLKRYFKYIMTWNDDFVDHKRVFKITYPYYFYKYQGKKTFKDKKLLTNISGCKFSNHPKELYSERLKVINYFEEKQSEEFVFYGVGWLKQDFNCCGGLVKNKFETYDDYKFALCLENMKDVKGYITEKIFDCFAAGIVPIYYGAADITDYIPQECFIDYTRFSTVEALEVYLSNMSDQVYDQYIQAINHYLASDKIYKFTSESFCEAVCKLCEQETTEPLKVLIKDKMILIGKIGITSVKKSIKQSIKKIMVKIRDKKNNISVLQRKALNDWFECDGDNTLRLDYELNEESVVFDLGGYKGEWSENIYERYHCKIYIFEPVKGFYEQIKKNFKNNKNIIAYNFGLDRQESEDIISHSADGSSIFTLDKKSANLKESEKIGLKKASSFIEANHIACIDLMKINIEGGEYTLLEHLIEEGIIDRVNNIQVQFHNIPGIDSKKRMSAIQENLRKTHQLTYQYYPYVWENWKRRIT